MKTVGIIPARLQSTRLPRKLLLNATGQPLIQYVWEAASRCDGLHEVIVATDSHEIAETVRGFGGRAEMTGEHPSGTDRIAEVVRRCCGDADAVVNIQGDEPELEPAVISQLINDLRQSGCRMATAAAPVTDPAVVVDPGCVKVVCDIRGRALYFSRAPIPFSRDVPVGEFFREEEPSPWLLHVGIYAYRRDFLLQLTTMPPSPLEQMEKLEQLRALQAGESISVTIVNHAAVGIDTAEDYSAFMARQQSAPQRSAA